MDDSVGMTRKFRVKHDIGFARHFGMFFCIEPKRENVKREIYLFICFGLHDFTIGLINDYD